jgi:hypothetical protein
LSITVAKFKITMLPNLASAAFIIEEARAASRLLKSRANGRVQAIFDRPPETPSRAPVENIGIFGSMNGIAAAMEEAQKLFQQPARRLGVQ